MRTAKKAALFSPGHDFKLPVLLNYAIIPFYNKEKGCDMDKYKCLVCGYIYDPAIGDPDNGVPAGTSFEKVPADWVCPECGAPKSEFEKI